MPENRVKPFAEISVPTNLEYLNPLDPDNPRSLINLASPKLRAAIEALPTKYFKLSEAQLRAAVKPTAELCRLRINFWDEYLRAQDSGESLIIANICKGVCSHRYFLEMVIEEESYVAFMIIPPADYQLAMRELLDLGWMKLREVLEQPIIKKVPIRDGRLVARDADGNIMYEDKVDTKVVSEIRHITALLDQRVKGAIVQKSLNVHVPAAPVNSFAGFGLAELEAMETKLLSVKSMMDKDLGEVSGDSEETFIEASIAEDSPAETSPGSPGPENPPEEKGNN